MSCSYAEGLSEYHDKGKLGLPEKFDVENEIIEKVSETEAKVSFEIIVLEGLTKISASKEITDREAELGVTTEII